MARQIPLPFVKFDRVNFDLYWPGPNSQIVNHLIQIAGEGPANNLFLWGEQGTGKSHLLQALCTLASSQHKSVIYIPLQEKSLISPELLTGMETMDIVCIDDVDQIALDEKWELAIFNLYNGIQENGHTLIVSARKSPKGLAIKLQDLKSRLASGVTYHIDILEEKDRLLVLQQRAHSRGIELSDDVIAYLSKRISRDMLSLFAWLDKMDNASMTEKKKLTIPFVRDLLNEVNKD